MIDILIKFDNSLKVDLLKTPDEELKRMQNMWVYWWNFSDDVRRDLFQVIIVKIVDELRQMSANKRTNDFMSFYELKLLILKFSVNDIDIWTD